MSTAICSRAGTIVRVGGSREGVSQQWQGLNISAGRPRPRRSAREVLRLGLHIALAIPITFMLSVGGRVFTKYSNVDYGRSSPYTPDCRPSLPTNCSAN